MKQFNKDGSPNKSYKHGQASNLTASKEYLTWQRMKNRCKGRGVLDERNYRSRGIKVCKRWENSFLNFFADMGKAPGPEYSLDRKNNDKGYSKRNCKWATKKQQIRNTRKSLFLNYQGKRMALYDWADKIGIRGDALYQRIHKYGWSVEKALTGLTTRRFSREDILEIRRLRGTKTQKEIGLMFGVSGTEISYIHQNKHYSDIK